MKEKDLYKLKEQIEKEQTIFLSSDFTNSLTIITLAAAIVTSFIAIPLALRTSTSISIGQILGGLLFLVLVFFAIYQFIYAAEAKLKGQKLLLKKVIGKEYEVDIKNIQKISTFALKSTKYTHLIFTDRSGKLEKALILNSNSFIFGKEISAGDIIKLAQQFTGINTLR